MNKQVVNHQRRMLCLGTATAAVMPSVSLAERFSDRQPLHVLNRLGYGPVQGQIESVLKMGIAQYVDQQLQPERIALPAQLASRLNALEVIQLPAGRVVAEYVAAREAAQGGDDAARARLKEVTERISRQTAEARLLRAIYSPCQLEEVMVDFWFNHFNVFAGKNLVRPLIASYERDAIRPYAMGSFRDLLGATARHPAMLFYLDNWLSTRDAQEGNGTSAKVQPKRRTGLNENYARELMELHTLGVDGGYSQKDVTELARILTGWTFDRRALIQDNQLFRFDMGRHDQGDKQWMGQHIGSRGQAEGEQALDFLARHPATARHLSYQLAQYFVSDKPPETLVKRMAQGYLQSDGNLREVLRTLFLSDEFMHPSTFNTKFKTPYQYVISSIRAADIQVTNVRPLLNTLNQLGMPLYGCQTPDGYKNTQEAWLNADALTKRIAFAGNLASGRLVQRVQQTPDADNQPTGKPTPLDAQHLFDTLGPTITATTRETIMAQAPALRASMVLGSPDFMQK
ncbi:MAG: DUF1800 domain-containing protein [Oxalicibacterium faecigallinarum]|uniref:DUF1800 domain-containing protein n=1 Tax=Oxalicibacterium faecigallinarum TaxID=573741 RepID=UPI0028081E4B|nr:DUF1800 domain-containing protein [Oxalicibacterium faecigallinarum]MDQ7970593.1 DUF1800 domain-containing protein [Oxalicibacterium faecigallinarum]